MMPQTVPHTVPRTVPRIVRPLRPALSTHQHPEPRPAWFWSCDSEAQEYTHFNSKILCWSLNGYYELLVYGVGTVELAIKNPPSLSNQNSQHILHLVDVLYVPHLPFNVIAAKLDIGDWTGARANSFIYDNDRNLVAYFQANRYGLVGESNDHSVNSLVELSGRSARSVMELSDGPVGPVGSVVAPSDGPAGHTIDLSDHPSYSVGKAVIAWQGYERLRWQTYKYMRRDRAIPTHSTTRINTEYAPRPPKRGICTSNNGNKPSSNSTEPNDCTTTSTNATDAQGPRKKVKFTKDTGDEPPYNSTEKLWLESAFGSEPNFLKMYGLNPDNARHRNEGRRLTRVMISLRAMISHDSDKEGVLDGEMQRQPESKPESNPDSSHPSFKFSSNQLKNVDWDKTESILRKCVFSLASENGKYGASSVPPSPLEKGMDLISQAYKENEIVDLTSRLSMEKDTTDSGYEPSPEKETADMVSHTCAEMERMNTISKPAAEKKINGRAY
ncbi:hypothetical protein CHU98_g9290 [Xylaria longipes]|nr:hypothetical protein CHU98_g9290 [Xylaria longipes]